MVRNSVAAALKRLPGDADAEGRAKPGEANIQTVTLNGFTILPGSYIVAQPNERRFIVRKPNGRNQEVVVAISQEARASAARMTRGVTIDENLWTSQAETFLSDFIWNDGDVPHSGRLVLKGIDRDVLEKLMQQKGNK
jgi:hypothetical protein